MQQLAKRVIGSKSYFLVFILCWFLGSLLWLSSLSKEDEIQHFQERFATIEKEQKASYSSDFNLT
jgi:3-deoxy-D-manno-octulosonic-acid transferase